MIEPKFVQFKTSDGLTLPGLFYGEGNKKCAIYLHGNGSSSVFYDDGKYATIAQALAKKGISFFPFNNRGAHIIKKLNVEGKVDRVSYGMAYERIKECVEDIEGAIKFLKGLGYSEFYLIGSSTGANKICVYNHYNPKNEVKKYILLSGGDDVGIYYDLLGKKKFWRLLKESKQKVDRGQGEEIISQLLPDPVFAYQGFWDIANPDGDYNVFPYYEVMRGVKLSTKKLFRYYKELKKPTLVIYGQNDEYAWGDVSRMVEVLKSYQPKFDYKIIENADHGFADHEKDLANLIEDWIV